MKEGLLRYLIRYGWSGDLAIDVSDAYRSGGIDAAAKTLDDPDDPEHDYGSEMRDCILKWMDEQNKESMETMTPEQEARREEKLQYEIKSNKTLRKELDGHLQNLKDLNPSRERSLAITKLQECIMWLGMDLKRLGGPNPYPESYNPDSPVVEPTADDLKL